MKRFCLSCNYGSEYSGSVPNFCAKCGKPYIDVSNATIKSTKSEPLFSVGHKPKQVNESGEDISGDATYVPKVGKIECEFNVANLRPNRQTSNDLFMEGARGMGIETTPRAKQPKVKLSKAEKQKQSENIKNEFRNEFLKNGKNTRNSTEIGE